ncbi:MAG: putative Rossmann fold flavoprotein [Paracoccaceae bacterium]|jgi:predicted Rossmann fold flavoprotein
MERYDVVILGAGAAGMMCALTAARRGRRVLLVDHNKAPGEKIRISGGGRCNFTNLGSSPNAFISQNPKFAISALKRFSQWDFIDMLDQWEIFWHEKTLGQLFCDGSARQIVDMFTDEMAAAGVVMRLGLAARNIERQSGGFTVNIGPEKVNTTSLVIATGGKSIPKMGATGFGYSVAEQFGLKIEGIAPGLVPLTFLDADLAQTKPLAGLSTNAAVSCNGARFEEGLLFTHRGLSGPSILQTSSYWRQGDAISVNLLPARDAVKVLADFKQAKGTRSAANALAEIMPKRLAALVASHAPAGKNLADMSVQEMSDLAGRMSNWQLTPAGSEGYRTAEVTIGGVSTDVLNSKTMQARDVPGLYFIGEVVDVTGWLGGYNFQWAWSSGWAAGQAA